ncbi:MAG: DUF1800 family protein, partial [Methylococcales bacterium]|nr:DUF1800 family protein [Methylococcales bacterium]
PSPTPTPSPVPTPISHIPSVIDEQTAYNFLSHASFGATANTKAELKAKGIIKWLDAQLEMTYQPHKHLERTIVLAKKAEPALYPQTVANYLAENQHIFNKDTASFHMVRYQMSAWFQTALFDDDQLRHKVAYALSQIIVESLAEPFFKRRGEALAAYFDLLTKHAFGNYKNLLLDISHSASMGLYLTYNGNKKTHIENSATIYPDENYAREIMQLFTIGLNQLNLDGTPKLDGQGNPIPTYTQKDVTEVARVFTGWDLKDSRKYGQIRFKKGNLTHDLEFTAEYHDFKQKTVLGKTISANKTGAKDIEALINILIAHDNMAPFISRQLIMRLSQSNPSPAYIARVATVFNDNGQGIKGDLKAVTRAIFLDADYWKNDKVKKYKEPLVAYTQFLRTFGVEALPSWYFDKKSSSKVRNRLFMNDPFSYLGQAPSRAFSVFNFYSNDYIPNHNTFKQQKAVAPELQIQTDTMLIAFNNKISQDLLRLEKRQITRKYGTLNDIEKLVKNKFTPAYSIGKDKFTLNCDEEYAVMEQILEGSVNKRFKSFNGVKRTADTTVDSNGLTLRDKAIKALIVHLDHKLTAGALTQSQKNILFETYKDKFYYRPMINADNPEAKIYETLIAPIITAIITSEKYMVH